MQSQKESIAADDFAMDLTKAFLKSNIALHKTTNPSIVEKHTKSAASSETTLRRNCIPVLFEECIEGMKQIAAGKFIWVSIDQSTGVE